MEARIEHELKHYMIFKTTDRRLENGVRVQHAEEWAEKASKECCLRVGDNAIGASMLSEHGCEADGAIQASWLFEQEWQDGLFACAAEIDGNVADVEDRHARNKSSSCLGDSIEGLCRSTNCEKPPTSTNTTRSIRKRITNTTC